MFTPFISFTVLLSCYLLIVCSCLISHEQIWGWFCSTGRQDVRSLPFWDGKICRCVCEWDWTWDWGYYWKLCRLNSKKPISFNLKCWMHHAPIQQLQGLHSECCLWLSVNTVNPCSCRYGVMAMDPECLLSISMCSTSFSSPKMVETFWKANVLSLLFCIHQGMIKQRNNITFYGSLLSLIFPFVQSLPFETAGPLGCILPP